MPNPLLLRLIDAGLGPHASTIAGMALPAMRLRVIETAAADWPTGVSKLGGAPDLPSGLPWPEWNRAPLAFIGQMDLRDLRGAAAARELPEAGMLSLFYHPEQETWGFDPNDVGSFRVFWFPPDVTLTRVSPPRALPRHARYRAGRLAAHEVITLPPPQAAEVEALKLTDRQSRAYYALCDEMNTGGGSAPTHQVLGHAWPIQGDMRLECQLASNGVYCGDASADADPRTAVLAPGASDWRLLVQVDSDSQVDMMWGDAGTIYYWITAGDLANRAFDRSWLVLQCS